MKLDLSGTTKSLKGRGNREQDDRPEPRITCYRCGREYPESELATIPSNAEPGQPRIYVCEHCR